MRLTLMAAMLCFMALGTASAQLARLLLHMQINMRNNINKILALLPFCFSMPNVEQICYLPKP